MFQVAALQLDAGQQRLQHGVRKHRRTAPMLWPLTPQQAHGRNAGVIACHRRVLRQVNPALGIGNKRRRTAPEQPVAAHGLASQGHPRARCQAFQDNLPGLIEQAVGRGDMQVRHYFFSSVTIIAVVRSLSHGSTRSPLRAAQMFW